MLPSVTLRSQYLLNFLNIYLKLIKNLLKNTKLKNKKKKITKNKFKGSLKKKHA